MSFTKFETFKTVVFSEDFSNSVLFFLSLWDSNDMNVTLFFIFFKFCYRSLRLCFTFPPPRLFFRLGAIILSSCSLILSILFFISSIYFLEVSVCSFVFKCMCIGCWSTFMMIALKSLSDISSISVILVLASFVCPFLFKL